MVTEYRFSEEEVQERFDEIMDLVENENAHIFITRDGEDIAVLIPYDDYQYYQSLIDSDWKEVGERNEEG